MNDEDLFFKEVADVKPLVSNQKVALRKSGISLEQSQARKDAASLEAKKEDFFSTASLEILDPYVALAYKGNGVQDGVFRRLKQGKYTSHGQLDLHKMTVEKARREVFDFIVEAVQHDLRCVTIVHGKGMSGDKGPVLKTYVNNWLPQMDDV